MIHITVSPKKYQLRIKGHADYAEKGQDIICASVSMVFYNLAQMILMYDEEKAFCQKPYIEYSEGKGYISIMPRQEYESWIQHDFLYAVSGFEMLFREYPEYVDLKILNY